MPNMTGSLRVSNSATIRICVQWTSVKANATMKLGLSASIILQKKCFPFPRSLATEKALGSSGLSPVT